MLLLVLHNPGRYCQIRVIVTRGESSNSSKILLFVWKVQEASVRVWGGGAGRPQTVPERPKKLPGWASGDAELQSRVDRWEKQRSKSLSFVTFRSKFRTLNRGKGSFGGSPQQPARGKHMVWWEEEAAEQVTTAMRARKGRSLSMPEITPLEQAAQSWTRGRDEEKDGGKKDWKAWRKCSLRGKLAMEEEEEKRRRQRTREGKKI